MIQNFHKAKNLEIPIKNAIKQDLHEMSNKLRNFHHIKESVLNNLVENNFLKTFNQSINDRELEIHENDKVDVNAFDYVILKTQHNALHSVTTSYVRVLNHFCVSICNIYI